MNLFLLYLLLFKAVITSFSGLASLPIVRNFDKSEVGNKPASAQAAYSRGAAWPFERINRSLL